MEFTIDEVFKALKAPLAVIDNPERRKQIEAYIDATRVQLERSVFDLLSQFADAVNREAGEHYEAALSYRPGVLDLQVKRKTAGEGGGEERLLSFSEGDVEKITLRIPAELKDLAVEAATKAGLSSNSWFVRMLARSLRQSEGFEPPGEPAPGRHGRHGPHGMGRKLTGWVGPEED